MRLIWKLAVSNLRRNRRTTIPFILASSLSVLMLYLVISLGWNPELANMAGGAQVHMMMGFGQFVVVLFMVIFLFYTNSFLMKQRKREFGLFNILGLDKTNIAMVLLLELVFCLAVSLVLGIGVGILLDKGMYLLIGRLMAVDLPLQFGISGRAVIATTEYTAAIYALLAIYGFFMVNVSSPIELLHADSQGEKEPKIRWALAVFGLISLAAGYWLALSVQNPVDAFALFFVAVILVIIGTYLLFAAGSIAILNLLQKNRRFYYQTSHFISVSGMKYRMKANAISLGNICILSTMVLVALSTTICLMTGMEAVADEIYPRNAVLSIYSQDGDFLNDFDQALTDSGVQASDILSYRQLFSGVTKAGNQVAVNGDVNPDAQLAAFMSLEDYNRTEGTQYDLAENEVLVRDETGTWTEETIRLGDTDYRVAGTFEEFPSGGQNISAMGSLTEVILPDQQALETLRANLPEGKNNLTNVLAFNSPDPEADVQKVKDAFEALTGARPFGSDRDSYILSMQSLYGGLMFIGVFVSILFMMACVLIMYYKQISEGYEDEKRFEIMTRVGLDNTDVKRTIRFQVLAVFFLPLIMAGIHIAFAFPMISKLLLLLGLADTNLFILTCVNVFAVFALLYVIAYGLTSRAYYQIVKGNAAFEE